jgi:polyhydroxyalkanoate synthase
MADKLIEPTWDPLVLAAQLQKIAQQSQTLMQRFVSNRPDTIKLGIGDTSSLGFDSLPGLLRSRGSEAVR